MPGPLSDLRVIDLSMGPAGGLATMVLADFGADVIKVEPPAGDPFRRLPSAPLWLRGKRSAALDLPGDADRLRDLVRGADVVVASYAPGAAPAGADAETLLADNPALVYCSITGWGPEGPYRDYPFDEGLVAAKAGRMLSFHGLTRRAGPAYAAVQIATHAAAQAAVSGILAALIARDRDGAGQLVETSLLQALLPYDSAALLRRQFVPAGGAGAATDFADDPNRMPTLNYHPVVTKDGRWLQLGNLLEHLFYSFADATGLLEDIIEGGLTGQPATWPAETREEMRDTMLRRMQERTAEEWMAIFRANGNVAAEPFSITQQALANPELVKNGDIVETQHPRLGRVRQLAPLARLEATPGRVAPVEPEVGEHTEAVLAEPRRAPRPAPAPATGEPRPPLDGVIVVEFATIIAAPLACSMLADLGARVIKVEPPGGDPGRGLGGGPVGGYGSLRWNTGKESICLDLKTAEGKAAAERLLAKADIVIHNYRPGVPERLGIGYERARELNPRVVYLAANGYGPDAPGAMRPCVHPIAGAVAGGALYQAGAGMPPERCDSLEEIREVSRRLMRANEVNPDPSTSMVIVSAALLGLYAARHRGVGQRVFVNMLAANAYANHDDAISYAGKPPRPEPDAGVYGRSALDRLYPAREGWVFLSVPGEAAWQALCEAAGRPDLAADARFADEAARAAHDAELAAALAALFAERDAAAWEALLIPAGVGCVRADAESVGEFWASDPQVRANGFVVEARHQALGPYLRHGPVVTFSRTPVRCGPGSLAGDHTDALLAEIGYDPAAIDRLHERGAVASAAGG